MPDVRQGCQARQVQLDVDGFHEILSAEDETAQMSLDTLDSTTMAFSKSNRRMSVLSTLFDGDRASNTAVASRPAPRAHVRVFANGNAVPVADGPTEKSTSPCFFTDGTGIPVRYADAVQQGDFLHWNGSVAGFQLVAGIDHVDFVYEV